MKLFKINLQLFAGDDDNADDLTLDVGDSDVDNESEEQSEPTVVYGKTDDEGTKGQDATDNNQPSKDELFAKFKEDYKEELQGEFQNIFNKRFKNHKELETKAQSYESVVDAFVKKYKVKDVEELKKIIDEEIITDLADEQGLTVEQYKSWEQDKRKAKEADEIKAKLEQDEVSKKVLEGWNKQADELSKKLDTELGLKFDFSEQLKNEKFYGYVVEKGYTLEDAYYLTHKDTILKATAKKAETGTVKNIQSKGTRIAENGLMTQKPNVVYKSKPAEFSDKDLDDIRQRVMNGERIVL